MLCSSVRDQFEKLPYKRKEVLLRILAGQSKAKIAIDLCKGSEAAVQQHLRQIYKDFHIEDDRIRKLPALQQLFMKCMPKLFNSHAIQMQEELSNNDRHSLRELPGQNLPSQTNEFIGREEEINQLLEKIDLRYRAPYITVDGIGGVGKSALVIEVAYRCWAYKHGISNHKTPLFDAIIFTTAKADKLLPSGIISGLDRQSNLREIFRVISSVLDDQSITQVEPNEQLKRVKDCLSEQSTLLIVDNLETLENQNEVLAFLDNLPLSTKAIITTRDLVPRYSALSLSELSEEESLSLIEQQVKEKHLSLNQKQQKKLYERFGGIPVALIYSVGMIASRYPFETLVDSNVSLPNDVARFCFESSVNSFRNEAAHKLLMAAAIFHYPPVLDAIVEVADLQNDPIAVRKGKAELLQRALLRQEVIDEKNRYSMLNLTREYVFTELAKNADFEAKARERWIKWYLDYLRNHGRSFMEEGFDWHKEFDFIQQEWNNYLAVLNWCATKDDYGTILEIIKSLHTFTYLYGYWEEHLFWNQWLIEGARVRGDFVNLVDFLRNKSWILIMIESKESLNQAEWLLEESLKIAETCLHESENVNKNIQESYFFILHHFVFLFIAKKDATKARIWLDKCIHKKNNFDYEETSLSFINGIIPYLDGIILILEEKYKKAEEKLASVVERQKKKKKQRMMVIALRWLAEAKIYLNEFESAFGLLSRGLDIVTRNKTPIHIAQHYHSLAKLEGAKNNKEEAIEKAQAALNHYKKLGMIEYVEEMKRMIQKFS